MLCYILEKKTQSGPMQKMLTQLDAFCATWLPTIPSFVQAEESEPIRFTNSFLLEQKGHEKACNGKVCGKLSLEEENSQTKTLKSGLLFSTLRTDHGL